MLKKIIIIASFLIIILISFAIYQFNQPALTKNDAIAKAGIYLTTVIEKMNLPYNTKNVEESSWYISKNDFWNKAIGNTRWIGFIDGVGINIKADTGDFIQMIFPLDGVITKEEHPDWFK
ncbi:hypothetical protein GK047_01180 [Paenibacillus sp. SYP-B3998]|uniref:Uncharacterized protein n=1 Tax=Paenibacillus sp. SYP-B3998 TaxID=2678564 RepID=A0A6G3ZT92_9BACL|nr:hypothetical protein [Paenibacillus sp. SYP-B3998]NEW04637.1 hypothetical protein [Paenibacillus sp. SYP-B3998]